MRKMIQNFYSAPDGFLKALLVGCETFILLALASIAFRLLPQGALNIGDTIEVSEAIGSAAVRCLVMSVMVGAAVGITSIIKPR